MYYCSCTEYDKNRDKTTVKTVDSWLTVVDVCTPIEKTLTCMSSPYGTSVKAAQHMNNTTDRFRIIRLVVFHWNFSTLNGLMSNGEYNKSEYTHK